MEDKLGRFLLKIRMRNVLPHIQGDLLDVGCGTNKLVSAYKGWGIGVDIYPWKGVDLVVDDTACLPFEDNSFDTVTVIAALNHIPNRNQMMKEAYRVLKDHGRVIITMVPPTIARLWHFLRRKSDIDQKLRGIKKNELYGLSRSEVIKILEEAGFKVIYEKAFMLGINRLTVALKIS